MNRNDLNGLDCRGCNDTGNTAVLRPPELDTDEYMDELDGMDMTEEQKREFLETLWSIMRSFAEMGFALDVCGQLFGEFNEASEPEPDGIESKGSTNTEKPAGKESSS